MRKKRASLHNLGCKVNAYELDVMEQQLRSQGYEIVPFQEPADICVINTCTVTNIADRKSRQMLHRVRKQNPDAVIVAVGCYVQTADPEKLREEGIDLCIGNNRKAGIAEILSEYLSAREAGKTEPADIPARGTSGEKAPEGSPERNGAGGEDSLHAGSKKEVVIIREDLRQACEYETMRLESIDSHTRAYIKIQDGCNQFCTYCIIPMARGRVRSRKREDILEEVRMLAESGVKEFVITGIHVSSYGSDFVMGEEAKRADCFAPELLFGLLDGIAGIPGVERIRLSSLEPRIMTEEFVRGLAENKKICPHFHLSLQSGSGETLRRMNRHYTAEEYAACVEYLRAAYDDPAITTDIIAGFPGETQELFEESCAFAERIGFYEMHVFPYSRRAGTPAAAMSGQLTEAQKAGRVHTLETIGARLHERYIRRHQGKAVRVLFEEERQIDGKCYLTGQSAEYLHIAAEASPDRIGTICTVKCGERLLGGYLLGVLE